MKILHPNKKKYLPIKELEEYYKEGFYNIIDSKEEKKLNYFLDSFEDTRNTYIGRIKDESLYNELPFSLNTNEWKERQRDVKIIEQFIHTKNLNILDIGSWNGWLSNHLAKNKHNVVAVNLFKNEFDGVKTNRYFNTDFVSLQMHGDEIFRIQHTFDLIVFNRNWAFIENKQKVFNDAKKLLSKNGIILFTGLPFYKNPTIIKNKINTNNMFFFKKYKIPLFYKPSKGYFEPYDLFFYTKNSIEIKSYQILKNKIKVFFPKKVKMFYCYYKNIAI